MRSIPVKYAFICLLALFAWGMGGGSCMAGSLEWSKLEAGIESYSFALNLDSRAKENDTVSVVVLRFDPKLVDFELLMASEQGQARTLDDWAQKYGLLAAINASMYLPDGLTSTGYMRRDMHANNSRVGTAFGAFFVAGPDNEALPPAAVLDRNYDDWENLLPHYKIVIQNFRMITPEGKPLWNGDRRPFSIAAVGQDTEGRILFLHCGQPVMVNDFVEGALAQPLGLERLMYVEGGYQAAMLVNTVAWKQIWTGRYSPLLQIGGLALLPNVLGVKGR